MNIYFFKKKKIIQKNNCYLAQQQVLHRRGIGKMLLKRGERQIDTRRQLR